MANEKLRDTLIVPAVINQLVIQLDTLWFSTTMYQLVLSGKKTKTLLNYALIKHVDKIKHFHKEKTQISLVS